MKTFAPLALALAALAPTAAFAGSCPEASLVNVAAEPAGMHDKNIDVTDTILAVNHLGDFYPEFAGRDQRIRILTVAPGGEVAMHSHADRPALIYVVSGEIVEHSTTCAVPIVHKAGEVATELGPLEHWWKNETGTTATLLSADLPRAD